eukprot:10444444-Prorocentrum_lima.AAC.1
MPPEARVEINRRNGATECWTCTRTHKRLFTPITIPCVCRVRVELKPPSEPGQACTTIYQPRRNEEDTST